MLSAQRCHDGPSRALLEYVCLAGRLCDVLSAQEGGDGMGYPKIWTPQIFGAFLRDSGTPIFQAPKCRRKNLRKICSRICAKICAPRICANNQFEHSGFPEEHSGFLEDGSQKKTQKRSAPNLRKTTAPRGPGKGAGALPKGVPCLSKTKTLKKSLENLPVHWGPLWLWARKERGRARELLPQKSLNLDRNHW